MIITNSYLLSSPNFNEILYSAGITILLIYSFLVTNLFLLLNIFDTKFVKTLSDLKKLGILYPFNLCFLILILSFAGVPPLLGFCIKLLIFIFILTSFSAFYCTILSLFNFFTLYFYVQNARYIINNSKNNFFIYANNFVYFSEIVAFIIGAMLLFNIGGILFISDFFI